MLPSTTDLSWIRDFFSKRRWLERGAWFWAAIAGAMVAFVGADVVPSWLGHAPASWSPLVYLPGGLAAGVLTHWLGLRLYLSMGIGTKVRICVVGDPHAVKREDWERTKLKALEATLASAGRTPVLLRWLPPSRARLALHSSFNLVVQVTASPQVRADGEPEPRGRYGYRIEVLGEARKKELAAYTLEHGAALFQAQKGKAGESLASLLDSQAKCVGDLILLAAACGCCCDRRFDEASQLAATVDQCLEEARMSKNAELRRRVRHLWAAAQVGPISCEFAGLVGLGNRLPGALECAEAALDLEAEFPAIGMLVARARFVANDVAGAYELTLAQLQRVSTGQELVPDHFHAVLLCNLGFLEYCARRWDDSARAYSLMLREHQVGVAWIAWTDARACAELAVERGQAIGRYCELLYSRLAGERGSSLSGEVGQWIAEDASRKPLLEVLRLQHEIPRVEASRARSKGRSSRRPRP